MFKNFMPLALCAFLLAGCGALSPKTSIDYQAMGEVQYKKGNREKAVSYFNKALEKDPDNIEAYSGRGMSYFALGDFSKAIEDFDKVRRAEPYRSEAYSALGSAYASYEKYDQAVIVLKKALELNPSNVEAIIALGSVYMKQDKYQAALEEYQKGLALRQTKLLYYLRGLAYEKLGKTSLAIDDYKKADLELKEEYK